MARTSGEMHNGANGVDIGDTGREGRSYMYTNAKVEKTPLYLSYPEDQDQPMGFEHALQLLQPASEDTRIIVTYGVEGSSYKTVINNNTATVSGTYVDGPPINHTNLGLPVTEPSYDNPPPRMTEVLLRGETQNDSTQTKTVEAQAFYIEEVPAVDETATEPGYEVFGTDPGSGAWCYFSPNRSCSAFLMKALAWNYNKLTATSRSAQTVAL
jgi:hypothetical protein